VVCLRCVIPPHAGYDLFLLAPSRESLETLAAWFDSKQLELPEDFIDTRYTLQLSGSAEYEAADAESDAGLEELDASTRQLHAAFTKMKSRRTRGKLVFEFPHQQQPQPPPQLEPEPTAAVTESGAS
jgi:hypothetical protein